MFHGMILVHFWWTCFVSKFNGDLGILDVGCGPVDVHSFLNGTVQWEAEGPLGRVLAVSISAVVHRVWTVAVLGLVNLSEKCLKKLIC